MTRVEYQREWKLKNREKVAAYHKDYSNRWYKDNPERYLLYSARARAKKFNFPFNLELSDILIPERCPILEIPLFRNVDANRPGPNSPSVDRIVPSLGYVKGNIQIISMRANIMKNDASLEELRKFASWVNQLTL